MSEHIKHYSPDFNTHAESRGVDTRLPVRNRVVIFGTQAITSLGNASETFQGLLNGDSGVRAMPQIENWRTNLGAPIEYDPLNHYSKKEIKRMDTVTSIANLLTRDLVGNADLLDGDGKLKKGIDRARFGVRIGSGLGPVVRLIDIDRTISSGIDKETGQPNKLKGSRLIDATEGLKVFPQDLSGRPAMTIGAQGESGSPPGACAAGGIPITDLYHLIREDRLDAGVAGGLEYGLNSHPEVLMGVFAQLRVTSEGVKDAEGKIDVELTKHSSRPFDVDRDGFVPASGGALLGLASEEFARRWGLPILGEIYNAHNSVDGMSETNMDIDNVARTVLQASYDRENNKYFVHDVTIAHGTSTPVGDTNEAEMYRRAFGEHAKDLLITGNKGNLGHTIGGAGAINAVMGVKMLEHNVVPPIANLENIEPEVADLQFVKDAPIEKEINVLGTVSFGFGGYNSAQTIGVFRE